ncbi:hypothetical protein G195_000460 [Phytophthora kernoviae 00238/432]|uniref:PhoH-like protein domain-containing protein n=1 Tax=Phytophthora kernoviae 00238/432 TaxID=1284355 RepID=A0A8J4SDW3_9STRA|nr:hypothetical protein G195_000460 [Phytophthora kernoviae 00238/432]
MVWNVEVKGNVTIPTDEVLAAAKKEGIYPFQWAFRLQSQDKLSRQLALALPDVTWIGVSKEGTTITIQVVESAQPKREPLLNPRHLIASREAEIVIHGNIQNVESLEQLFDVLLQLVRNGYVLTERDVKYAIELAKELRADQLLDLFKGEITTTYRGKTYLAVVLAVAALKEGSVKRIVLTRPAVEAGESLGFLPGDLQEKVDPYLRPLYDALYDVMGQEQTAKALERGLIEIAPLAYMRGRTLDDSFIILDEAQNTTPEQMKMFLTRLGFGSKMVITGDVTQIDLPRGKKSGLVEANTILGQVEEIGFVYFAEQDVDDQISSQDKIDIYRDEIPQRQKDFVSNFINNNRKAGTYSETLLEEIRNVVQEQSYRIPEETYIKISRLTSDDIQEMKAVARDIVSRLMTDQISEATTARAKVAEMVSVSSLSKRTQREVVQELARLVVTSNRFYDEEGTKEAKVQARENTQTVFIKQGDTLVAKGEMITPEMYTLLGENDLLKNETKRPIYFIENQNNMENPHDSIDPKLSKSIIVAHARDGVEMQKDYKLPRPIRDIAEQHHGTTFLHYFYHKALRQAEEAGVEPDFTEDDFRYPGPKAQSKESAIVGIADSVEAAVRSLRKPTVEQVESMIEKIIKGRLDDHQFNDCDLTMRELDIVAKTLKETVMGIFHSRIEYPEEMKKPKPTSPEAG